MTTGQILANQYDDTRAWTNLLIDDFTGDEWTFQPQPGLHHALWLCGHLTCAADMLLFERCVGQESVLGMEFRSHFPIGGAVASAIEHKYPSVDIVLERMTGIHNRAVATIRALPDEKLTEPAFAADGKTPHPHYFDKLGLITHLTRHEAFHAGQIALLRRLMGKAALR